MGDTTSDGGAKGSDSERPCSSSGTEYEPAPSDITRTLNDEHRAVLNELRMHLLRTGKFDWRRHTDYMLIRFARARDFNVEHASQMIDKYETWRKETNVDELVRTFEYTEELEARKIYPQFYHGTDKIGRPLYIESYTRMDPSKLMTVTTQERMIQRLIVEYERMLNTIMPACSIAQNTYIGQSCTILDVSGISIFSFFKVHMFLKSITAIAQSYYPEILGTLYLINPSTTFQKIFSLISSLIPPATLNKIKIVDSKDVTKTLLEVISCENLPKLYGGSCNCGSNEECEKGALGPWHNISETQIAAELERRTAGLEKWAEETRIKLGIKTTDAASSSTTQAPAPAS